MKPTELFSRASFTALMSLGFLTLITGCDDDNGQNLPEREYRLVWSDDFDGDFGEMPDSTKWTYDIGTGQDGWGNQELQAYTNDTQNVVIDGEGNLAIIARRAPSGNAFTSGRIKTEGLFGAQYGRVEARIKLPYGPGIWPAFWMLGTSIDEVGWPQCGEIDIMEFKGQEPNTIYGSVHGPGYSAGQAITVPYSLGLQRFDTDFKLYAIEWGEDYIDFFVDDFRYKRVTPEDVPGEWVYNNSFFIILNVAVGGTFVGFPVPETPFPQTMLVDYVRVYEEV